MKRLVLIFVVMFLAYEGMLAQEKETVAVYVAADKEDSDQDLNAKKIFGAEFVNALVNRGEYKAVERTASFLNQLSKETAYQQSGAVSDNKLSQIGKQLGADYVCAIDICNYNDEKHISARLIHTETAEIFKAKSIRCEMWDNLNLEQLTDVAAQLVLKLIEAPEISGTQTMQINGQKYLVFPSDSGKQSWSEAKKLCESLTNFGKSDWYLPSKSELDAMYKNKEAIGGFADQWYWSSSEDESDESKAWDINFNGGGQFSNNKNRQGLVRCIRKY